MTKTALFPVTVNKKVTEKLQMTPLGKQIEPEKCNFKNLQNMWIKHLVQEGGGNSIVFKYLSGNHSSLPV